MKAGVATPQALYSRRPSVSQLCDVCVCHSVALYALRKIAVLVQTSTV